MPDVKLIVGEYLLTLVDPGIPPDTMVDQVAAATRPGSVTGVYWVALDRPGAQPIGYLVRTSDPDTWLAWRPDRICGKYPGDTLGTVGRALAALVRESDQGPVDELAVLAADNRRLRAELAQSWTTHISAALVIVEARQVADAEELTAMEAGTARTTPHGPQCVTRYCHSTEAHAALARVREDLEALKMKGPELDAVTGSTP